jgi:hypothetical protein
VVSLFERAVYWFREVLHDFFAFLLAKRRMPYSRPENLYPTSDGWSYPKTTVTIAGVAAICIATIAIVQHGGSS